MITIVNNFGAPEAIAKATQVDRHITRGTLSVTQLIDAPQITYLRKNFDYEEDVRDRFWMILGTAVHGIMETSVIDNKEYWDIRSAAATYARSDIEQDKKLSKWMMKDLVTRFPSIQHDQVYVERTLTVEVDGMDISGTQDVYYAPLKTLEDYKLTSTYASVYKEQMEKHEPQQNIYAYMLRKHGHEVETINIVALYKDWSKNKATIGYQKDYPKAPWEVIPIRIWSDQEVEDYMKERIKLHRQAMTGDVPPCTIKERWATHDAYAVMKKGQKKAVSGASKFTSEKMAQDYIDHNGFKLGDDGYIQHRPGTDGRCENFCAVASVCPQRKERLEITRANQNK